MSRNYRIVNGITIKNLPDLLGSVTVTNFPTTQTIDGSISVDNFPASYDILGSVTLTNCLTTLSVTGPLTDTQLRASDVKITLDSETVSAAQSGTWSITNITGTVSLPTGAATSAKQDLQPIAATTITEYNITCTNANTEYSQALPANTRAFEFRCRTLYDVRYAFTTGKVAGSVSPYFTLGAGYVCSKDNLNLTSKTLYLASATAGVVVEVVVYT